MEKDGVKDDAELQRVDERYFPEFDVFFFDGGEDGDRGESDGESEDGDDRGDGGESDDEGDCEGEDGDRGESDGESDGDGGGDGGGGFNTHAKTTDQPEINPQARHRSHDSRNNDLFHVNNPPKKVDLTILKHDC